MKFFTKLKKDKKEKEITIKDIPESLMIDIEKILKEKWYREFDFMALYAGEPPKTDWIKYIMILGQIITIIFVLRG